MLSESSLDYSKAKPNRFFAAGQSPAPITVTFPDLAQIFTTSEAVNRALRALNAALPNYQPHHKV